MPTRNLACRAILVATTLFLHMGVARAEDSQALKDRLHAAEKDTTLSGNDVQPFYLKMSVQLLDAQGKPSEQGTVEIFREGTGKEKLVYSFPSYSATEVHVNGSRFRTPKATYPPTIVSLFVQQILNPLPQGAEIDGSSPQVQRINLRTLPLDCITLAKSPNAATPPPLGLVPAWCFGPADNAFRVAFLNSAQVVVRNSVTPFQQKHIAFDIAITGKGVRGGEAKITTLEQRSFSDSDFSIDGLPQVSDGVPLEGPYSNGLVRVSAGVMAGFLLTHVDPQYPQGARIKRVQGTVVLHVQIGIDGHIQDLQVVSAPDADLAAAAMDAVRQWKYRPYILGGLPVAVETNINVNFTLGP
jgi:TonB family protein